MKRRLNIWIMSGVLVFVGAIIFNMFNVSVAESDMYQKLANQNQFGSIAIHANRGSIYDVNGQILAQSATVFNIILDPTTFRDKDSEKFDLIYSKLQELFNTKKEDFEAMTKKTGSGARYQVIAKKVEKPTADLLTTFCKENKISCISILQDTKRYYLQGDLAASVIGFLDGDGNGQYGLEAYYDDYLAGVDGRIVSARDAQGNEMPYRYEKTFDAKDGNSLVLTIDATLQHYLEKGLKEAVSLHNPQNRSCGIIMNAKTGAILAMATVPGFDLNSPAEIYDERIKEQLAQLSGDEYRNAYITAREKQWKNKAITELYYPGSVFKVVTGSSALEEKVIDLNSTFVCQTMDVYGAKFHCWSKKGHGVQNFVQAMTNSCNPAFIQIGQKLGASLFSKYYAAFGFTEATGIDLPGEAKTSLYYDEKNLGPVQLASSSFGQTNKVTPIQMITAYAAVINGGKLLTPYVVSKIVDNNGNVVKSFEPKVKRQVISEETSKIMRQTLESVVNNNGGSNSYIQGYRIGGKSGTSEKQDEDLARNRDDLYVSSYVGFAPADDPEIIMLVMVDEPSMGEYYGSIVAVPVVTSVFKEALPYLGYYPQYTEEELAKMDITVRSLDGQDIEQAKTLLQDDGLKYEVIGNGTTVCGQVPEAGNSIPRGGKVILYTEENYTEETAKVPNLIGMNASQANSAIANLGLNIKISGNAERNGAVVISQNWPEGSEVSKGTVIEVTFAAHDQY